MSSGVLILAAREPVAWLWTRVLGDGLDAALLCSATWPSHPGSVLAATAAVAPAAVLDTFCASRQTR